MCVEVSAGFSLGGVCGMTAERGWGNFRRTLNHWWGRTSPTILPPQNAQAKRHIYKRACVVHVQYSVSFFFSSNLHATIFKPKLAP